MVVQENDPEDPSQLNLVSFPSYRPSDVQPHVQGEDDFWLRSQCMVLLAGGDDGDDSMDTGGTDSICLFLYEVRCPCSQNLAGGRRD